MINGLVKVMPVNVVEVSVLAAQKMCKNVSFQRDSVRLESTGQKTVNVEYRVKVKLNLTKSLRSVLVIEAHLIHGVKPNNDFEVSGFYVINWNMDLEDYHLIKNGIFKSLEHIER